MKVCRVEVEMSKEELMGEVEREVRACRKCGLWTLRKNPVVGSGSLDAVVMFIGEAPGYWEDIQGKPFVGAAGKLLDKLLLGIGLSRSEVYIGNLLKCRPPKNRDPKLSEVEACTPYLDRQIGVIRPRIIVTLGRHSTAYILSKMGLRAAGISGLHGGVYEAKLLGLHVVVIPMYHPAAALYNVRLKEEMERDFQVLRRELLKRGFLKADQR